MWYLVEDFFDQNLVMKGMLGLGWLCVLIMAASFVEATWTKFIAPAL